ncbi:hypothetical protein GCM10017688_46450 [Streptomyces ramulosus]
MAGRLDVRGGVLLVAALAALHLDGEGVLVARVRTVVESAEAVQPPPAGDGLVQDERAVAQGGGQLPGAVLRTGQQGVRAVGQQLEDVLAQLRTGVPGHVRDAVGELVGDLPGLPQLDLGAADQRGVLLQAGAVLEGGPGAPAVDLVDAGGRQVEEDRTVAVAVVDAENQLLDRCPGQLAVLVTGREHDLALEGVQQLLVVLDLLRLPVGRPGGGDGAAQQLLLQEVLLELLLRGDVRQPLRQLVGRQRVGALVLGLGLGLVLAAGIGLGFVAGPVLGLALALALVLGLVPGRGPGEG